MTLNPPYNNGTDPEIRETNLERPLKWIDFVFFHNRTPEGTEEGRRQWLLDHPIKTAKDNYGWRQLPNFSGVLNEM